MSAAQLLRGPWSHAALSSDGPIADFLYYPRVLS
jgi:hypothetical protein